MTVPLNGVATAAAFPTSNTGGCQIPPVAGGFQLDLTIGNAAAVVRLFNLANPDLGIGGGVKVSDEFVVVAGTSQIAQASYRNCVGFQARDFVSGTHATVYAVVWEKGDPVPLGGSNYGGTLSGSGSGPGGSTVGFKHNGTLIASESNADFEDGGGVTWTLTDDPGNSQVKIAAAVAATRAALSASPANPARTTALAPGVMMGLGASCNIIPFSSGKVNAAFFFGSDGGGFGDTVHAQIRFGVFGGGAPVNGAAATGTATGGTSTAADSTVNWWLPTTISGLSIGTLYYFDLCVYFDPYGAINSGGVYNIGFQVEEL